MNYNEAIAKGIKQKAPRHEIARKLYLCYPTCTFIAQEELEFEILNDISSYFDIPFTSVQVVGSAKTGFSYHQNKKFVPGKSDLDIAIIDLYLFTQYCEISYVVTDKYLDLTKFKGHDQYLYFIQNIAKGMLRPDLMPRSKEKDEWFKYFNNLSSRYYKIFKNINAGIYSNHFFFESKQEAVISHYLRNAR